MQVHRTLFTTQYRLSCLVEQGIDGGYFIFRFNATLQIKNPSVIVYVDVKDVRKLCQKRKLWIRNHKILTQVGEIKMFINRNMSR